MNKKLPYYLAYPMPLAYDDERIERMDFEYMKSLYPEIPRRILPYVEEECDRMEYENSMVYDEYPDRLQLRLMCGRICENIRKHEREFYQNGYEEMFETPEEMTDVSGSERCDRECRERRRNSDRPQSRGDKWLRDLVEVMLYQELYKRRSDNRRKRRRFY